MLFSVVIPTHNRAHLLPETLDSVFAQTFKEYEVIVVDDGSTDNTNELLRKYSWVKVLRQQRKGPGIARNYGVSQSTGRYVAFLDSDDLWFPWTLASFAKLIPQHNGPAILGARLVEFSGNSELAAVKDSELKADAFADYFASHRTGYFVGAGMSVLRRDEFLKTGGYTTRPINAEDHDLILRMGNARGFVQMMSPVTLGWRQHGGSATTNLDRTLNGAFYLIEQERRGIYPGGPSRAGARREIITSHIRPVILQCLRHGFQRQACKLYRETLAWNAALGRVRFLVGFPLLAVMSKFRATEAPAFHLIAGGQ